MSKLYIVHNKFVSHRNGGHEYQLNIFKDFEDADDYLKELHANNHQYCDNCTSKTAYCKPCESDNCKYCGTCEECIGECFGYCENRIYCDECKSIRYWDGCDAIDESEMWMDEFNIDGRGSNGECYYSRHQI
jgi:hypothetical protein